MVEIKEHENREKVNQVRGVIFAPFKKSPLPCSQRLDCEGQPAVVACEQFLEEYKRNTDRIWNVIEGIIAIQELLAGEDSRDVHLSDSGRIGLSSILHTLNEELENALGSLPMPDQIKKMLEEVLS